MDSSISCRSLPSGAPEPDALYLLMAYTAAITLTAVANARLPTVAPIMSMELSSAGRTSSGFPAVLLPSFVSLDPLVAVAAPSASGQTSRASIQQVQQQHKISKCATLTCTQAKTDEMAALAVSAPPRWKPCGTRHGTREGRDSGWQQAFLTETSHAVGSSMVPAKHHGPFKAMSTPCSNVSVVRHMLSSKRPYNDWKGLHSTNDGDNLNVATRMRRRQARSGSRLHARGPVFHRHAQGPHLRSLQVRHSSPSFVTVTFQGPGRLPPSTPFICSYNSSTLVMPSCYSCCCRCCVRHWIDGCNAIQTLYPIPTNPNGRQNMSLMGMTGRVVVEPSRPLSRSSTAPRTPPLHHREARHSTPIRIAPRRPCRRATGQGSRAPNRRLDRYR